MDKAGRIDIVLNAVGMVHVQGTPLAELTLEEFSYPVTVYTRTNFITAQAAARHMVRRRSGVILTLSTPASRMPGPGFLGHSVACAGVEALTRHLAGELGPSGIRVVCLRSHAIPEAAAAGSHSLEVFRHVAARTDTLDPLLESARPMGAVDALFASHAADTLLKRLPTLSDIANTATFLASDHARTITGAIANLTCGFVLD
jgi:NAD(P)-dependent dehydrogenase (short-subunit alcohol dehydrogenase family)